MGVGRCPRAVQEVQVDTFAMKRCRTSRERGVCMMIIAMSSALSVHPATAMRRMWGTSLQCRMNSAVELIPLANRTSSGIVSPSLVYPCVSSLPPLHLLLRLGVSFLRVIVLSIHHSTS